MRRKPQASNDADLPFGAVPLETLPPAKVYPPGEDMGDLTPPDDDLDEPPGRPNIRVVTMEATPAEPAPATQSPRRDSGGHDPTRPIGKGNPPRRGQQQAGEPSKNPRGRPPGIPNPDKLTRFLGKRIDVTLPDGRKERMSRAEHLLWLVAERAARGDRHMRKLQREQIEAEVRLAELRHEHDLRVARAGEQPKAPPAHGFERLIRDSVYEHSAVLRRLRDLRVVDFSDESYAVADWMRAAIAARRSAARE